VVEVVQHLGVAVETDGFAFNIGEAEMRLAVVLRLGGSGYGGKE
jgi:hypothetical protein